MPNCPIMKLRKVFKSYRSCACTVHHNYSKTTSPAFLPSVNPYAEILLIEDFRSVCLRWLAAMATPSDFYSYPHDALHNQLLRPPSPAQQSLLEKRRKAGLGPRPEDCIKPLSLTLKQLRDGVPPEEALQPKLEGMKTFLENYIVRLPHGPGLAGHDMSECM